MAKEALTTLSGEASADLSADQFKIVIIDTNGRIALAGAGVAADGVLQDKPTAAGQACSYAVGGVTKLHAGASLGDGVDYTSDSAGRAVAATTGNYILGKTRTVATAAGQIIEGTWEPKGRVA